MSHTVTAQSQVRDLAILQNVCHRFGLPEPELGDHRMFDGKVVHGYNVKLPNWRQPCVFGWENNAFTGNVYNDTYGGSWGNPAEFDKLMQGYAVDYVSRDMLQMGGLGLHQYQLEDGSIVLECALADA